MKTQLSCLFFAAVCLAAGVLEHAVFLSISDPAADCAAWSFRLLAAAFLWLPVTLSVNEPGDCRAAAMMSFSAQAAAWALAALPGIMRGYPASADAVNFSYAFMCFALSDFMAMATIARLPGITGPRRGAVVALCLALTVNALLLSVVLRRNIVPEAFIFLPVATYSFVWPADMLLLAWCMAKRTTVVPDYTECSGTHNNSASS